MNNKLIGATMLSLWAVVASASISVDMVTVGNPGNEPNGSRGSVSYSYNIGKYEITTAQYVSFLNDVGSDVATQYNLHNNAMASGGYACGIEKTDNGDGTFSYNAINPDKPVNYLSAFNAMRFCNWLTSGDTETGVYMLNGTNSYIGRNAAALAQGGYAISTLEEWYKAAYYDPTLNDGAGGYWTYAIQSDTITTADANYDNSIGNFIDVGSYSGSSYYGTFDQNGNLREMTLGDGENITSVVLAGGTFLSPDNILLDFSSANLTSGVNYNGFRIVQVIPEPSAYACLLGMGAFVLVAYLRRKQD